MVKSKKFYGRQTEQAINNFPFPGQKASLELIYSITEIKKAAALAHKAVQELPENIADAIVLACNEILAGKYDDQFPLPSLQGGAGTSINMNVNEVIASLAAEKVNKRINIHPNDHVNKSQSTNDVNPSALKITCIKLTQILLKNLDSLIQSFEEKAKEFKTIPKLGRTHIQDALPTTLGAEFLSYASALKRNKKRLEEAVGYLYELNLGGTAIGNSINASDVYITEVYRQLKKQTGLPVKKAENLMSQTSSSGDFCHLSGVITILFTDICKIATDLRFLSSGPRGGIGEIRLKALQAGSSIMPGKINPVIPEAMNQIAYDIVGKNITILQAAQNANLELAIMFPILAHSLISLLKLASSGVFVFGLLCVSTISANQKKCKEYLEHSTAYATLLTPKLGYDVISSAVKEAIMRNVSLRTIIIEKQLLSEEEFDRLISY